MKEIAMQQLARQFIRTDIHCLDSPHFKKRKYTQFPVITKAEKMIVLLV